MKIAFIQVCSLGFSPNGAKACFQRRALNTWAMMPKGKLSSIHCQDISLANACLTSSQRNPRYIHHRIAAANINGRIILLAEEKKLILNVQCSMLNDNFVLLQQQKYKNISTYETC